MNENRRQYLIQRTEGEPDWAAVPRLEIDRVLWMPDCGIRAWGQIAHDGEQMYVHLRAAEKAIRAEYTAPLSPVHQDSCLEFFFMPENESRYFNFEINPNGCLHTGFGTDRTNRAVLCRKDAETLFAIRTGRTADGWEAFYRIPLAFLRIFQPEFTFTGTMRANAYKCGDLTEHEHYCSWNPVTAERPDFHRPQDFGVMRFE